MFDIYSQTAELALASYVNFVGATTGSPDNILRMTQARMTQAQALNFADHFPTIAAQYRDSSGLDVTVFKDADGNATIAFRGTEFSSSQDLLACADIAGSGAAYEQIVAMVNWWLRESSTPESAVVQYRLQTYPVGFVPTGAVELTTDGGSVRVLEEAGYVEATGNLATLLSTDADGRANITGHSLGGHLAMAFSTIFASVSGAVTAFNAPGFLDNAKNQAFFDLLGGSVPAGSGSITNIAANEALVRRRLRYANWRGGQRYVQARKGPRRRDDSGERRDIRQYRCYPVPERYRSRPDLVPPVRKQPCRQRNRHGGPVHDPELVFGR